MQEIAVDRTNNRGDTRSVATQAGGAAPERCVLSVDCSERNAVLLDLARRCDEFDVRIEHLAVGDVLQGLPGVGPALAHRLLSHFGSIERVIAADEAALARVRGIGQAKAARIRQLVA